MNEEQIRQIIREEIINTLGFSSRIPLPIDQAIRDRFLKGALTLEASSKSATSENQAVNEGGAATYSVLKAPDSFLEVAVDGTTYYIPVFT